LASTSINISPDIALSCEVWRDEIKKVFKLEKTELRARGWDYIFTDVETGETIHPGDPGHPNGMCRITSQAAEDLDGSYSLTVDSPWEASQSTSIKIIGPTSSTRWAGAQPGELTAVVTVNNVTASERAEVYQSGCS
jgi:hypothetical protein